MTFLIPSQLFWEIQSSQTFRESSQYTHTYDSRSETHTFRETLVTDNNSDYSGRFVSGHPPLGSGKVPGECFIPKDLVHEQRYFSDPGNLVVSVFSRITLEFTDE